MSTITFDTQELVRELHASGLPSEQADAVVRAIVKSHDGLATRADLDRLEAKLDARIALMEARVDAKFDKMTWMIGVLIAIAAANFAKQFF